MNKILLSLLLSCLFLPAAAQLNGDGYYRVKNFKSERYIVLIDNKSKGGNISTTTYDLDAMMSVKPFSKIDADAGSVVYIENEGGNQYNIISQGTDAYQSVGRLLTLTTASASQQTYFASATESGVTVYLYDEQYQGSVGRLSTSSSTGGGSELYRHWRMLPVSATDDNNYFGVKGNVQVGGKYYTAFHASFPYTFASSGMKAYIVTKLDGDLAVWKEVEGTVAAATPVIIACAGENASSNRLNLELQDGTALSDNLLLGVYFNNTDVDYIDESSYHFNAKKYNPATMRLLGITSEGKLGFVKSDLKYIPKNASYLKVPKNSPAEITLVTQEEYDALLAADVVTVTAKSYTRPYGDANPVFQYDVEGTLKGQPTLTCEATPSSPVGVYPIVVGKGTVTNRTFNAVNGTLTVEKAPLTVTARSYTIKQNEPLPLFECDFQGFKLGETAEVLTSQPALACNVPEDKKPGVYAITVSGAAAQNYDITTVDGTLTILEADPITVTAVSLTKEYGDAMPALSWKVEGGTLEGQPLLQCEVNESTPVGTYPIKVYAGTIDYPNLTLVDGSVTVTKAPLIISAGNYTMKQTDERPQFQATYEGFKLDETEAVLTQQPVLSTNAPADNTPGEYVVEVSGAEAQNYDITYKSGSLVILAADPIVITVADATMVYGDEVPTFSYTVSGGEVEGEPAVSCEATSLSPAGSYPIVVSAGTINYPNLVLVNGTLAVTKAPLTASVGDYEREQGQPNPVFEIVYEGFRNGDDASVFTTAPVATTTADENSAPGAYDITLSGGEAANYDFIYQSGHLVVYEANQIVLMAVDATMVYGDEVPTFTYTVSGGEVVGEAVLTCEATSTSPVGTYPIVISAGTVSYPNLLLVNGTLTVTKAPLTATVGDYEREQGQPNPDFEIVYEGFRNGDDASVFTVAPVATTIADEDSTPGIYDIVLTGGEAQNYDFTYVNGKLTVTVPSAISTVTTFSAPVDVYSLTGRLVRSQVTSLKGLPRGIYLVNGRKVVVK